MNNNKVVIYGSVSTNDQTTDNQLYKLKEVIEIRGWDLVDTYTDEGISGSKGRDKRPEFDRLCKDMCKGKFDRILVWDVSRLGRSLQDLVVFLNDLNSVNVDLYIHQSGLDTSTPSGRMMFQMVGVFSEFERSMIGERVKSGLEDEGILESRTNHKDGEKDGLEEIFYWDGTLNFRVNLKEDTFDGLWESFHEDGTLINVVCHQNDIRRGMSVCEGKQNNA